MITRRTVLFLRAGAARRRAGWRAWLPAAAFVAILVSPPLALAADEVGKDAVDAQFKAMDANGDGKVSRDEHAAGAKRMFATMDADGDGKVTAAEMDGAHEKVTGRKPSAADMPAAEKIKVVDTDRDGVLSAEEHASGSGKMFDRMDANRDGALTRKELSAGHAKMLHGHGGGGAK